MVDNLPSGWEAHPLSALCEPVTKREPVEAGRVSIRYVDIGSVDGDHQTLTEVQTISAVGAPSRARQVLRVGDTVFSTVRPYLRKIAYIDGSLDREYASTGFTVLLPGARLVTRYLFHYCTSTQMSEQVLPHQRGVSYPAVRDKDVLAAVIPVPPLDEQRRIVEILEDHLSRLDAAEVDFANALQGVVSLRESTVRAELTGSRAWPRSGRAELDGVGVDDGSLPAVPPGWQWMRLYEVADVVGGITKDAKRQSDPTSVEVPYLRVANVQRGRLDLSIVTSIRVPQATAEKLRLLPGDVLLNEGGDRDKLGRGWVWEGQVEP